MSSFYCDKCKKAIIDTPQGYITECKHYPKQMKHVCKNCKYYEAPTDEYFIKDDKGTCNCDKLVAQEAEYPLDDKLEYSDYEGYQAFLRVGSNFGCIHFKNKL